MNSILKYSLLIVLIGCKKQNDPNPTVAADPCPIYSKAFEGKFVITKPNHDTINIVFTRNYCPDNTSNQYTITGLNEAVQPSVTSHTMTPNYVYYLMSKEVQKTSTLSGYLNSYFRLDNDTTIYVVMPTEGVFYFTKIH